MKWKEPRPVDEWMWMDVEIYTDNLIDRVGRVSWSRSETGLYSVNITVESEDGLGLYCWPKFLVRADAQAFVERLMLMPLDKLKAFHGTQWPNVVL